MEQEARAQDLGGREPMQIEEDGWTKVEKVDNSYFWHVLAGGVLASGVVAFGYMTLYS